MHDDYCDGCEECTEEWSPVPSRRWRWLDLGICFMDFAAETALSMARALAAVNDAMRAHYNYEIDRRSAVDLLAESDTISLSGE